VPPRHPAERGPGSLGVRLDLPRESPRGSNETGLRTPQIRLIVPVDLAASWKHVPSMVDAAPSADELPRVRLHVPTRAVRCVLPPA